MPWRRIAKRYELAEEKLEGMQLTTDEEQEIRRLLPTNKNYQKVRYIFLFLKKGWNVREISAVLNSTPLIIKKHIDRIRMSPLLSSRINIALEKTDEITEIPKEEFDKFLISTIEKKLAIILRSITPEKIHLADLGELSRAFSVLFDKYRTATGKSNINILGISAVLDTNNNINKIQELKKQIEGIDLLLKSNDLNKIEGEINELGLQIENKPEIKPTKIITKKIN